MSDRLAPAVRRRGLKLGLVNAAIYSMGLRRRNRNSIDGLE
jgi:hypothetical protein